MRATGVENKDRRTSCAKRLKLVSKVITYVVGGLSHGVHESVFDTLSDLAAVEQAFVHAALRILEGV